MNIEEKIEKDADKMAEKYYGYYIKKYPRKLSQVKEKFMPYFIKAAQMFCIRDEFNADKFIDAFMADGFKFPAQMCYENVWNTYIDYLPMLKEEKNEEIEIVESIVNAAIVLKKAGGMKQWLSSVINQKMVKEQKMPFSVLLPSFSEAFINFCNKECEGIYNFTDLRGYVLIQKSAEKILRKIKEVLGIDYYRFDQDMKDLNFIF